MNGGQERTDVLVVGGGPGGLACARLLAENGVRVTLAERKPLIGPKVCAGGITWHGLLNHVPAGLIERAFPEQHIVTPWQRLRLVQPDPIIATISRERLGQWMAEQAQAAGARLLTATRVTALEPNQAVLESADGRRMRLGFAHLVGADGANSMVRRSLGLPSRAMGLGLNVMLPVHHPRMEWHLDPAQFGSGYAWIFPHGERCSLGVYGDAGNLAPAMLKRRLLDWAGQQRFRVDPQAIRAGLVNYDYQGVRFGRTWLVGEAAGLVSGLTGEGIYPALVSGQAVARMILDPAQCGGELQGLARKQRLHRRLVGLATRHRRVQGVLVETTALLLRLKIIAFHRLEMAD